MASLLGLLGAVALLVVLTVRGINLFVATPVCALVIALTSHLPMLPQLVQAAEGNLLALYMQGFTGFIANWFFMFLLGSIFGKLMELSGAAESIARWVIVRTGRAHAALAVVLACAVLTYGGVSLFVVAFSVYPTAVALFREANLPRRFIPAALSFGSVTFTMTSAGSPEIQNWIPIQFLHTSPWAAWEASLVVAVFMAVHAPLDPIQPARHIFLDAVRGKAEFGGDLARGLFLNLTEDEDGADARRQNVNCLRQNMQFLLNTGGLNHLGIVDHNARSLPLWARYQR